MKGLVVLGVIVVLFGASAADAGKRLTTGSNGAGDVVECTAVNTSDTKTVVVDVRVRRTNGVVPAQNLGVVLPPFGGTHVAHTANDVWCEFVIVDGSTKDLRASSLVYEAGVLAASEPAREK